MPAGTTDLKKVLDAVVDKHESEFSRTRKNETVLVITDGEPNSKPDVCKLNNRIISCYYNIVFHIIILLSFYYSVNYLVLVRMKLF
jgi:hypothetical protein